MTGEKIWFLFPNMFKISDVVQASLLHYAHDIDIAGAHTLSLDAWWEGCTKSAWRSGTLRCASHCFFRMLWQLSCCWAPSHRHDHHLFICYSWVFVSWAQVGDILSLSSGFCSWLQIGMNQQKSIGWINIIYAIPAGWIRIFQLILIIWTTWLDVINANVCWILKFREWMSLLEY